MITHTIESYWIRSQKKTKSKLQIKNIGQNFKFFNFQMGTEGQTDKVIPVYPPFNFFEAGGIIRMYGKSFYVYWFPNLMISL